MKLAISLEIPTEAKLCLQPQITSLTQCLEVVPLLKAQDRIVDAIIPDGNCLFRALSKALFAVQSGHLKIRQLLVNFIQLNAKEFSGLCNGSIASHCAGMKVPATFGTQAELYAAASLFQIPVYVFYKRSEEEGWEWMMYDSYNKESLQTPARVTERAPENVLCIWTSLLGMYWFISKGV